MHRIPPSQKIRKRTEELLNQGLDGEADVTSLIVRLGIERVAQEIVEQEVTDYLERDHYQRRRPDQEHRAIAMATSRRAFEPRKEKSCCRCLKYEMRRRPIVPG